MFFDFAYPLQLISCFMMTGVIAVIQLIHYPSFLFIDRHQFENFHRQHTRALGFIAGPMMCLELLSGLALAFNGSFWWIFNLTIIVVLWIITFLISVPAHNLLSTGFNEKAWKRLMETNWLRTFLWVSRSVIFAALWIMTKKLEHPS